MWAILFPWSLFFPSHEPEEEEGKKRDPGDEVGVWVSTVGTSLKFDGEKNSFDAIAVMFNRQRNSEELHQHLKFKLFSGKFLADFFPTLS